MTIADRPDARRDAVAIALLFLVATSMSTLAGLVSGPVLAEPDYLGAVAGNEAAMVLSSLLMLGAAAAIPTIPILLHAYFRRESAGLSLAYLVIRCFEAAFYLTGAVFELGLIAVARRSVAAAGTDSALYGALGDLVLALQGAAFIFGPRILFSLGALVLSVLLYRTRLVPRWLSAWTLAGALLLMGQGVFAIFGIASPAFDWVLVLPIAVAEMVFSLWLIAKGFDPAALDRLFVRAPPGQDIP